MTATVFDTTMLEPLPIGKLDKINHGRTKLRNLIDAQNSYLDALYTFFNRQTISTLTQKIEEVYALAVQQIINEAKITLAE